LTSDPVQEGFLYEIIIPNHNLPDINNSFQLFSSPLLLAQVVTYTYSIIQYILVKGPIKGFPGE